MLWSTQGTDIDIPIEYRIAAHAVAGALLALPTHCRHCGPERSICEAVFSDMSGSWQVFCGACGSSSGSCKTEVEAVALWNTRAAPSAGLREALEQAAADVLAERERQKSVEGWTPEHDAEHNSGDMAMAAACYAISGAYPGGFRAVISRLWPWDLGWWKPKSPRRDLVRSGALILAEIERLDRAALTLSKERGDA